MRTIVIILLLLTSGLTGWAQSENDFYRDMIKKPVASKEDLVRAVARFRGYRGPDMAQEEAQHLLNQGVRFRKSIMKAIRAPVTKGEAVNLFLNAMDSAADQRGLMGRLFTRSVRYAARDGMAQKLLPSGSYAHEFMSGAELLAMLGRAVEQAQKKGGAAP
ncbi:MAG: hypothetical protein A3G34_09775 [Candidatus Lindowbacteria bacterium RIFCSPLOWO2_12_FULL_62_27]|nr:MAG: hypothetical protein A3G34_09775 [Candidatus Lindowbacteria bacterium RIFCSPLOWO2_12_FULL_62_27]OGH61532.1 MAG: hypothetical protein A3I06_02775 [Candidatus Lindowbacteria bacterium RIFCSPLOWO2_02_FULL_62_12]